MKLKLILSDGSTPTVSRTIRESVAAETYFRANPRYGSMSDNPFRAMALAAFSAGQRDGVVPKSVTFDQFLEAHDPEALHLIDVEIADEPTGEEAEGLGEDTGAAPTAS